ncbi:MAG: RsmB/NOP family class I SAM-dependent RNA methyltransferase [Candidatus Odinarchaeota archaeon]|nr:RsmB/NOP family class I SAM-dependent RNA methyltransferase [Candidatus Odinarchaeota archaeon]
MLETDLESIASKSKFSIDVIAKIYNTYQKKAIEVIEALKRPPSRYFLRINKLKVKDINELISRLEEKTLTNFKVYEKLEDVIYFEVKGPFEILEHRKKIIADKIAAESVFLGSNLYAPGVIKCDPINRGDNVSIFDRAENLVGSGIAKMNHKEIFSIRRGIAVEVTQSIYRTPNLRDLEEYYKGLYFPQSLPAILVSYILDPKPNDIIVDVCAAPGGKTTAIAELMENKGLVIAIDRSKNRLKELSFHKRRLGLKNIRIIAANILDYQYKVNYGFADKVLVDPPCSNLGLRPKLFDFRKTRQLDGYSQYQKMILKAAYKLLKKGGILVYSTCTITKEENENVVQWAMENLNLEPIKIDKKFFIGSKSLIDNNAFMRFEPHINDTPGFFIAKLRKI